MHVHVQAKDVNSITTSRSFPADLFFQALSERPEKPRLMLIMLGYMF